MWCYIVDILNEHCMMYHSKWKFWRDVVGCNKTYRKRGFKYKRSPWTCFLRCYHLHQWKRSYSRSRLPVFRALDTETLGLWTWSLHEFLPAVSKESKIKVTIFFYFQSGVRKWGQSQTFKGQGHRFNHKVNVIGQGHGTIHHKTRKMAYSCERNAKGCIKENVPYLTTKACLCSHWRHSDNIHISHSSQTRICLPCLAFIPHWNRHWLGWINPKKGIENGFPIPLLHRSMFTC